MPKLILKVSAAAMMLAVTATPVLAQVVGTLPASQVTGVDQIINIINYIVRVIFTVLMIVAIAFILWAAYKYLTAMGDPGKVADAHKALLSAAIAIAVALIATGVRAIVEGILRQG
jgi:fumarate reductase subunit D